MDSIHPRSPDLTHTHPTRLAHLMGLDEAQSLWSEEDLAAMALHLLESTLPQSSDREDPKIREILLAPRVDLEQLREIKEFAKACRGDAQSALPQDLATVLYYAAISAALLRGGARITRLTPVELRDGLRWALGRAWVPEQLKSLFRDAADSL